MQHHATRYRSLTATTLDAEADTLSKYPQAEGHLQALLSANNGYNLARRDGAQTDEDTGSADVKGLDFGKSKQVDQTEGTTDDESFEGFPDSDVLAQPAPAVTPTGSEQNANVKREPPHGFDGSQAKARHTVYYSTDATKLTKHRQLKRRPFNKIIFNFPHVGGKSTDVNRQVRYNQEMLHAFLGEAKEKLEASRLRDDKEKEVRRKQRQQSDRYDTEDDDEEDIEDDHGPDASPALPCSKQQRDYVVLVTLFEGEPYTLWNIKDLARSNGLECRTSWAFDWSLFPSYKHARTLGNLRSADKAAAGAETGGTMEDTSKSQGKKSRGPGWRGEDRKARTYEFSLKAEQQRRQNNGRKQKRKRSGDDSFSDSD